MKAKNSEGKTIKDYKNPMLPLMPTPNTTFKEEVAFMVCGYCGGRAPLEGKALRINGVRVHPLHESCIKSANRPLFDMSERVLR